MKLQIGLFSLDNMWFNNRSKQKVDNKIIKIKMFAKKHKLTYTQTILFLFFSFHSLK